MSWKLYLVSQRAPCYEFLFSNKRCNGCQNCRGFLFKGSDTGKTKILFILTIADISAVGPGSGMHTKVNCLNSFIKRHMQNYQVRFWMSDRSLRAQNKIKSVFSKADFNKGKIQRLD